MKSKKAQIAIIALFLVFTLSLTIAFFAVPKVDYNPTEKRYLAEFPEISVENFLKGGVTTGLEGNEEVSGYIPDHFPFRSFFVGLNAYANLAVGSTASNDYYFGKDGYIVAKPDSANVAPQNLSIINSFSASFDEVTLMVVPSPGYILEDKLPLNHISYPDEEVYEMLESQAGESVNLINPLKAFKENYNKGEELYYKTDHHWTSQGAYLGYTLICENLGHKPVDKAYLDISKYEGFYGTTYSSSGYYLNKPDTLEIWENQKLTDIKVTITEKEVEEYDSMYFTSHLSEDDMYPVFLDGNHPIVEIENPNSSNADTLIVIKDSYAHCLTPFLVNNYSKVIMVDMRYYRNKVTDLADENTDILFLYSMSNFTTDTNLTFLY